MQLAELQPIASNDGFNDDLSKPFYTAYSKNDLKNLERGLCDGSVSFLRVSEVAITMTGMVMDKFTEAKTAHEKPLDDGSYKSISQKEKRTLLSEYVNEIKWCVGYLNVVRGLFEKYIYCQVVIDGALLLLRDAEVLAYLDFHNEVMKQRNPSEQKTYFFQNPLTKLIKIGKSNNIEKRKKMIEIGTGAELEILYVVDENIEGKLHRKFKEYRVHGEWFDDKDGLIQQFINEQLTSEGVA